MEKPTDGNRARGFTLLEMIVAMAVFLVMSGAALALFSAHQPLFNQQQSLAGLNIAVRNTVSQLQIDVVNAGNGYYQNDNIPDWPVGVTISNSNPAAPCDTPATYTYSSTCFDQLNIIATDPNTAPEHPDNGTLLPGATNCISTKTSPIVIYPPPTGTTAAAATAYAANFKSGDELLLVDAGNSSMTTIMLTAAGTVATVGSNSGVQLAFDTTSTSTPGLNTGTNDPLGISTNSANPKLNDSYCSDDWILRLDPITYQVDTSTASDPKLVRVQGGSTVTLAEQVIGFKVGASAWNGAVGVTDDMPTYSYLSSNSMTATPWGYNNEWWLIRSVQISLIARTTPATDPTYVYRNGFDGGPYQIESVSVVVNPRNLTMDNQ